MGQAAAKGNAGTMSAARFYLGNGNENMAMKALSERMLDGLTVDVDGLAEDLGISRAAYLRRREQVFRDLECQSLCETKRTPSERIVWRHIEGAGGADEDAPAPQMLVGMMRAKEFLAKFYQDRTLFGEPGQSVKHQRSSHGAKDPPDKQSARPVPAHKPRCEPQCELGRASPQKRTTLKLTAAGRQGFFAIKPLYDCAPAYAGVSDRAGKSKRACMALATEIARERGVPRESVWEASRAHPNCARLDTLDRFLALFHGPDWERRLDVDSSAVSRVGSVDPENPDKS